MLLLRLLGDRSEAEDVRFAYELPHLHETAKSSGANDLLQKPFDQEELIAQFDPQYGDQWASFGEQYRSRMLGHIVGFELIATRVETKFKLSQNRTRTEQENIIRSLAGSPDSSESDVAELMRERGLGSR
jgi:predicted FMN-binding regulatory protein PaiB